MREPVKFVALLSGYALRTILEGLGIAGDTDQTQQKKIGKEKMQDNLKTRTTNWKNSESPKGINGKSNGKGTESHIQAEVGNTTGSSIDMVNHPPHYASSKIECIDAMEAMTSQNRKYGTFLTGHQMYLWQVIFKYIWRFPFKEKPVEDLKKAKFYLERLINRLEDTK
jgi:hypothetical protein